MDACTIKVKRLILFEDIKKAFSRVSASGFWRFEERFDIISGVSIVIDFLKEPKVFDKKSKSAVKYDDWEAE